MQKYSPVNSASFDEENDDPDDQEAESTAQDTPGPPAEAVVSQKQKRKKTSKIGSYPTRCQYVGNMACLFLRCYRLGRFPLCSIGPSWPFTIGLLTFAGVCLGYLLFMVSMLSDPAGTLRPIAALAICLNLALLFGGICGDPGVKPSIYLHHSKMHRMRSTAAADSGEENEDGGGSDDNVRVLARVDAVQADDEESGDSSLKKRNQRVEKLKRAHEQEGTYRPERDVKVDEKTGRERIVYNCYKCNIEMTPDMDHCDDCDVCVDEYDHHCVFFSKCIGGGNLKCFYGSIGMLIFNFVLIGVFVVVDASRTVGHRSRGLPNGRNQQYPATTQLHEDATLLHSAAEGNIASGSNMPPQEPSVGQAQMNRMEDLMQETRQQKAEEISPGLIQGNESLNVQDLMIADSPPAQQLGAAPEQTASTQTLVHSEIDNSIKDTSNI